MRVMIKCFTRESEFALQGNDKHIDSMPVTAPFKKWTKNVAQEIFDEIIVYNDSTEVWKQTNIKQNPMEHQQKTKSTNVIKRNKTTDEE